LQKTQEIKFQFYEKGNALFNCVQLASRLQWFNESDISNILKSEFCIEEFDAKKIREINRILCDRTRLNIFLISKSFEGTTTETAPYYETKYSSEYFSKELQALMKHPFCDEHEIKKLDLPLKNDMIPENFEILQTDKDKSEKPELIFEDDYTHLWYMKDEKFNVPKCQINMKIYTTDNGFGKTIESVVFGSMWVEVAN
jgi:secreted Zn-dependent insulinase-like peptidase